MKQISLLIFTATLVVAVSCNKSTSSINPDPTPTPSTDSEKTIEFVLPVTTDNHNDFFEQQFEFDMNGSKVTFKESDMIEMTAKSDLSRIPALTGNTESVLKIKFGTGHNMPAQYYRYTLGKLKKGETMSAVSRKPILNSDRPSVEEIDFLFGYDFLVEGSEDVATDVAYHVGVPNTDAAITSFFNTCNKDFQRLTYTYK